MQQFQKRIINNSFEQSNDSDIVVLSLGCEQAAPGKQVGPCVRNKYILLYVLAGHGSFCGQPLNNTCGFLICPNQKHEYHSDTADPMRYAWISFAGNAVPQYLDAANIGLNNHIFHYSWAETLDNLMVQACAVQPPSAAATHYLLGWFQILLSYHMAHNQVDGSNTLTKQQQYISTAIQYMNNNFYHSNLRISDIAAFIGIDRHYLSNIFTREIGISPQHYLIRTRMDHARAMLQDQSLSITEVALSVGYRDSLQFSKLFRQYTGMSPTECRQNLIKS